MHEATYKDPEQYGQIIIAWYEGKTIQFFSKLDEEWVDRSYPTRMPKDRNARYRVKPETIEVNGKIVPAPFKGELKRDQTYYKVYEHNGLHKVGLCENYTPSTGKMHVESGMVHLTGENAEAHAGALNVKTEIIRLFNAHLYDRVVLVNEVSEKSSANLELTFDKYSGKLLSANVIGG